MQKGCLHACFVYSVLCIMYSVTLNCKELPLVQDFIFFSSLFEKLYWMCVTVGGSCLISSLFSQCYSVTVLQLLAAV